MVKKYFLKLFVGVLVLSAISSNGQDIHFTQFYMQPLSINPALSGDFLGDSRGTAIYRRQWGQLGVPIVTSGFSYEKKIRIFQDFIGVGGQLLNDKVTEIGLNTNKIYAGASYMKFWKKNLWHLGVQVGYVDRSLDLSSNTFPSQYNGASGTFDLGMVNGEIGLNERSRYFDVAVGLLWVKKVKNRFTVKTGISFYHLNRPQHSFAGAANQMPLKYVIHNESSFWLNGQLMIQPKLQVMRIQNATDVILVVPFRRKVNKTTALYAGPGYRGYGVQSDAAILVIGGEFGYIDVGVSMDWNVSSLSKNAGQKSTIEWSAVVRTPPKKYKRGRHGRKMPCIKYPAWE